MALEILRGPITGYLNLVDTLPPIGEANVPNQWVKMGKEGDLNYGDEGVMLETAFEVEDQDVLGSLDPIDQFVKSIKRRVEVPILDMRPETQALLENNAPVTTVLPTSTKRGYKQHDLYSGFTSFKWALILVGISPYNAALRAYWWLPCVGVRGIGQRKWMKSPAVMSTVELRVLRSPSFAIPGRMYSENLPILAAATAPAAPLPPSLVANSATEVTVYWRAPYDGGAAVDTYSVQYRVNGSPSWTAATGLMGLSYKISGLSSSTTYEVQVRATNSVGDSAFSTSGIVVTS